MQITTNREHFLDLLKMFQNFYRSLIGIAYVVVFCGVNQTGVVPLEEKN